ncbi:MAG: hypothetical protein WCJ35_12075 [Planctomycetota bacterium]
MNILKRLSALSVVDLNGLQREILGEIQRRQNLSRVATGEAESRVIVGQKSGERERSVAVSKPTPATRPVSPRRAA